MYFDTAKTFQITLYKIQLIRLHFKIPEKREKSYGYYTQLIWIIIKSKNRGSGPANPERVRSRNVTRLNTVSSYCMLPSGLLHRASVSVSRNFLHLLSFFYGATGEMTPGALFLLGDGSTRVLLHPQSACSRGSG